MRTAIVIGCGEFDDPDIGPLKYAADDADAFARKIQDVCDFLPEQIFRCYCLGSEGSQSTPTRANIIRALTSVSRNFRGSAPELLVLFFSGHGFHSKIDGVDYLITSDTVTADLEATALSFSSIERYLRAIGAKHTVLFLDACRAVVQTGKSPVADAELAPFDSNAGVPAGMVTFFSCKPGQLSYESDACHHGLFTYCVLTALGTEARCSTVYELNDFFIRQLPLTSQEFKKPRQDAFTRVEPLDAQYLRLVSLRQFLEWSSNVPIGREIRHSFSNPTIQLGIRSADRIFAVDFGTTRSAIGLIKHDQGEQTFWSPGNVALVPTVIAFDENLNYEVGAAGLNSIHVQSKHVIRNFKRLLGRDHVFNIFGKSLTAEFAASLVIRSLKTSAEEILGGPVQRVIASYPVGFTIRQMNALADAFSAAGLNVERFVAEPCAATYLLELHNPAPDVDQSDDNNLGLFIDLGGGTLDVAALETGSGVIEILVTDGDRNLGSADYDDAICELVLRDLALKHEVADVEFYRNEIMLEAERAKIDLGAREHTSIILRDAVTNDGTVRDVLIDLTRETFRVATQSLNNRFESAINRTLAKLDDRDRGALKYVFLTGQGSKVFTVQELVKQRFLDLPIVDGFQQDAVIKGLCLYAEFLEGTRSSRSLLLLNVVRRAIGVRYANRTFQQREASLGSLDLIVISGAGNELTETIIEDYTTIPTKKSCIARLDLAATGVVAIQIVENYREESEVEALVHTIDEITVETADHKSLLFVISAEIDANGSAAITFHNWGSSRGIQDIGELEFRISALPLPPYKGETTGNVGKHIVIDGVKWTIQRGEIFREKP
jgi:molecular chaperone DnaK (HSP70)